MTPLRVAVAALCLVLAGTDAPSPAEPAPAFGAEAPASLSAVPSGPADDAERADRLMGHVRALAALEDRSLGGPGAAQAAEYVQAALTAAGPGPVGRQSCLTPVLRHERSDMRVIWDEAAGDAGQAGAVPAGQRTGSVPVRPLFMNAAAPGTIPPPGLSGRLVWVGRGTFSEMNGKAVAGNVVLMDLDSGGAWEGAAGLGAKALVFVDRGGAPAAGGGGAAPSGLDASGLSTRGVFEDKWEATPVAFPRFWLPEDQARALFGAYEEFTGDPPSPTAVLTSDAAWRRVRADNVWKLIPGSDPALASELAVIEASYDVRAMVADRAPGADEAASAAVLLEMARTLEREPPRRSVLLAATSGRSQSLVGMRELVWSLTASDKETRTLEKDLAARRKRAESAQAGLRLFQARLAELTGPDAGQAGGAAGPPGGVPDAASVGGPASARAPEKKAGGAGAPAATDGRSAQAPDRDAAGEGAREDWRQALGSRLKTEADELTETLMRLRLEPAAEAGAEGRERLRALAERRLLLRRLAWREDYAALSPAEGAALAEVVPRALAEQESRRADAAEQLAVLRGVLALREALGGRRVVASASLLLSSHGDGLGAFAQGSLYRLRPDQDRARSFAPLSRLLGAAAAEAERTMGLAGFFQDALLPDRLTPWRDPLPDRPALGGEAAAMAGLAGFSLATTNDCRALWGAPADRPETVDAAGLARQADFALALLRRLISPPAADGLGANQPSAGGFSVLTGRTRSIRQGEVFAEQPAPGALALVWQGETLHRAMADSEGVFRVRGLADRKRSLDKAVLDAYRIDPGSGEVVWAVDRAATDKNSYRLSVTRRDMETGLVLFPGQGVTLFGQLEPRTFRRMTRTEILDGRRDAPPVRFGQSRVDAPGSGLANVYLPWGVPLKALLSDTPLRRKALLLNADAARPQGRGYLPEERALGGAEYLAARDMWAVAGPRAEALAARGAPNELVGALRREGEARLAQAAADLAGRRYDAFMENARASLVLAGRVYGDVQAALGDVLAGALFYVALFAPFAYCLERLFFSQADIHRRILAWLAILAATMAVVFLVHPAFRLIHGPLVVVLAFFILGLSTLVGSILFLRFEREMAALRRRTGGAGSAETGRGKVFAAAFALGAGNLRRRPLRTGLTCATLVLLTFAVMSFTSVKSYRRQAGVPVGQAASWQGIVLRDPAWRTLPPAALAAVANRFAGQAEVAPRGWLTDRAGSQALGAVLTTSAGRRAEARAVMGLSAEEASVSGLDAVLAAGRWFAPQDRWAVILPQRLAERLGVVPGDRVTLWGLSCQVVGLTRPEAIQARPDLDGEPLAPVFFPDDAAREQAEAAVATETSEAAGDRLVSPGRYRRASPEETVWLPCRALAGLPGFALKSMAVSPPGSGEVSTLGAALAERFALAVFSGGPGGSLAHVAGEGLSYAGLPNVAVPLGLAGLIVLNAMIGSVHERRREIGVYASLGLAPSHISLLFLAESLAFAVLSVVFGYLLAQTGAWLLAGTAAFRGLTANYSSLAGVAAMFLVMAVTLVSTLYPARMAAGLAIPDVNRAWTMPRPQGDVIEADLPFLLGAHELQCAGGYLCDYYAGHADVLHGLFSTADVSVRRAAGGGLRLEARIWLAPFDFGVRQSLRLDFRPSEENPGFLEIRVLIRREAGEAGTWQRMNRRFLNDLRRRLLVWRSLGEAERVRYEALLPDPASPAETA